MSFDPAPRTTHIPRIGDQAANFQATTGEEALDFHD